MTTNDTTAETGDGRAATQDGTSGRVPDPTVIAAPPGWRAWFASVSGPEHAAIGGAQKARVGDTADTVRPMPVVAWERCPGGTYRPLVVDPTYGVVHQTGDDQCDLPVAVTAPGVEPDPALLEAGLKRHRTFSALAARNAPLARVDYSAGAAR